MAVVEELLSRAIEETSELYEDEVFLVRDLFKGYEWKRLRRNEKMRLGAMFFNYVQTTGAYLQPLDKTSLGQQKYIVIGGNK